MRGCVMRVLVDTSVWIRFLANRGRYAQELDRLLEQNDVVGHEFVYGELLLGDRGGRAKLLSAYLQMYQASLVPQGEVVAFVRARRLFGRGIGWVDAHLLASAVVGRLLLWTADSSLESAARDLGIVHSPVP